MHEQPQGQGREQGSGSEGSCIDTFALGFLPHFFAFCTQASGGGLQGSDLQNPRIIPCLLTGVSWLRNFMEHWFALALLTRCFKTNLLV